ncbi:MAG: GNAT family N-acetyltransferase, partial [Planctomycetes bacterium]|nr:GNAT family N-acetyltransferase [Planctomycetota bacterium]
MSGFECIHDKNEIERFARENVYMHIYTIGDLDDFFWPHTQWYGTKSQGRLRALACLYVAQSLPTLLLFSEDT